MLKCHRIATEAVDPWGLVVSADRFAEQLRWLMRRRTVLPLAEFALRQQEGCLPPKEVAITFDGGYACNAHIAGPLLMDLGLPATLFLSTGSIEGADEYWWDALQRIVFETDRTELAAPAVDGSFSVKLGPRRAIDDVWTPMREATGARQRGLSAV